MALAIREVEGWVAIEASAAAMRGPGQVEGKTWHFTGPRPAPDFHKYVSSVSKVGGHPMERRRRDKGTG